MNGFFENIISFPVVLLVKLLKIFLPILLLLLVVVSILKAPHIAASFMAGFLVAPPLLRRLEIYHLDVSNGLAGILEKNQQIGLLENTYRGEINSIKEQQNKEEKKLTDKIVRLSKQAVQLNTKYRELVKKKPDKFLYDQPRSFLEWIRGMILHQGGK